MAANSMHTRWSQVEGQPKNACSVVEMHMLGEGHMLGSRGKTENVKTQLKNSICSSSALLGNKPA